MVPPVIFRIIVYGFCRISPYTSIYVRSTGLQRGLGQKNVFELWKALKAMLGRKQTLQGLPEGEGITARSLGLPATPY